MKNQKTKIKYNNEFMIETLYILWLIMFIFMIIYLKEKIFNFKTDMPGGWYSYFTAIYTNLLPLSFIGNYKMIEKKRIITQIPALLILFVQGSRGIIILIFIAIFLDLVLVKRINFFKLRYVISVFLIMIFGILGTDIIVNYRNGQSFKYILENVIFNTDLILMRIRGSEPFTTQSILNQTITNDIKLGSLYPLRYILKLFFIPPKLYIQQPNFYEKFVGTYYPDIDYGIAYNIFSEPYAIAGMVGVFLLIIGYGFTINVIDNKIQSNNKIISTFALSLGVIFSFRVHRNSVENMIFYIQVHLLIFIIIFTAQLFKNKFKIKIRRVN